MKKILFVIPTMRMGGAEQSLVSLLNVIDLEKYEVDLLLFEKNGELLERIPKQVNVIAADTVTRAMVLEFRYFFKDLLKEHHYLAALVRLIMLANSTIENAIDKKCFFNWNIAKRLIKPIEKQYDVAIGYLEGTTDAYIVDKIDAKKKIGWVHTNFSKSNRHFSAEGKYYRKLNAIAIISDECKKYFLDRYPELSKRTYVIENLTDRGTVLEKAQEQIEDSVLWQDIVIVTVGRLEQVKGIDIAVEAAKILSNRGIGFTWHVFGDGIQRNELNNLISQYHLENQFILDGTTKNPYKYMRRADIIVQPSRNEGKSMVLDEAKLLCRPIVVTNYPSAKDQIEDGKTGIIAEINPESIADKIEKLMESFELREALTLNCGKEKDDTGMIIEKIVSMIEGE